MRHLGDFWGGWTLGRASYFPSLQMWNLVVYPRVIPWGMDFCKPNAKEMDSKTQILILKFIFIAEDAKSTCMSCLLLVLPPSGVVSSGEHRFKEGKLSPAKKPSTSVLKSVRNLSLHPHLHWAQSWLSKGDHNGHLLYTRLWSEHFTCMNPSHP